APPSRTSRRPTTRTGTCQSTPPSQHALRSSSSSPPPETPRCTPARPPTRAGRSSRSASANRAADGAAETKTPPQPHGQPTGGAEALRRSLEAQQHLRRLNLRRQLRQPVATPRRHIPRQRSLRHPVLLRRRLDRHRKILRRALRRRLQVDQLGQNVFRNLLQRPVRRLRGRNSLRLPAFRLRFHDRILSRFGGRDTKISAGGGENFPPRPAGGP